MVKINAHKIMGSKKNKKLFYNTDVRNPLVKYNNFIKISPEDDVLPLFSEISDELPAPFWDGHQNALNCYWKAWEIAFSNLRKPKQNSGFITNFIDTAFNKNLFMWDSAFIVMFGRYGTRVFDFQKTLNNFYAHQHYDGYICREIRERDGADTMMKYDVCSTGPNILPWAEWEYFLNFGDEERLLNVFYPLLAYYQWFRTYRSWQNGTYFSSGWGCGMDNQPRLPNKRDNMEWSHGHMSWIDITFQQILAGSLLIKMAERLGKQNKVEDLKIEVNRLKNYVNEKMWDENSCYYYDCYKDGKLSTVKTIGAYWALLAEAVPQERLAAFIDHLRNVREFNRPHRIPSLSADHELYHPKGLYWLGGVWPSTNYMVLRGLNYVGEDELAHEIAINHLNNVIEVFNETETLWENYAPEIPSPGQPAKDDFVGWTGLVPISVLIENVLGIRPNTPENELIWDIRLLERHGIQKYPFGRECEVDLECDARDSFDEEPTIKVKSSKPIILVVKWKSGKKKVEVK